ncbi:flagellar hook-length control protein FliK [Pseudoduganella sp. R-32]|uniref:flagellar hook-length control protein FliK n=1 Tax=Pseudoduganella sp. R-32 TaxID=3404061 RepID=UPI003CE6D44C
MQTQTVQNSPLLSGNSAGSRSSNGAQEDKQFAQALNSQIERQARALPPSLQPQANAAPRRAEAPKPAAQQPSQQAKPASSAPAPANKPATQAQAPAKAQQSEQPNQANHAAAPADVQPAPADAASASSATAANASSSAGAASDETDSQQAANDAVADMLAMIQGLAQPTAADAASAASAAAAAAAASTKDGRATETELASDAVLSGKGGRSSIAERLPAEGMPVDQEALLAAKAAAEGAGKAQDPSLADALAKARHGAAAETGDASASSAAAGGSDKAAAQPRSDFQAALQQASTDAGKAADAAALDTKHAIQPQASALQAAATALAPAGAANAQAAQALASNQLHARVGSQGWDHQLGQKVVWMVNGGEQSATLTLNPPDLGPLQVVLSVSNDQASVAFTAAQPEVREALEQALPKLRETMGEAGITLGDTSVSSGSQDQQQAFADMAAAGRGRGVADGQNDNGEQAPQAAPQVRRSVLSAVDTFA